MAHKKKTVYLAGPITGLTHDEARYGWRKEFADMLSNMGLEHIECSSPMRGKEFLKDMGALTSGEDYPDNAMSSANGILTRDFNDVITSDAMIACFLESNNVPSLGTAYEFGFAWSHRKPIITIGPEDDVNIKHVMAQYMHGYRVDTLQEGAMLLAYLLTPGM